jgi:hypothetical protein
MAQIHSHPFPQKCHIFFTPYTAQKKTKKLQLSLYGRSYRAVGRYDRAYTVILAGMTGLTAGHTGHTHEVFTLAENLAGMTGLMAGMTGHTLNCQKTVGFFYISKGIARGNSLILSHTPTHHTHRFLECEWLILREDPHKLKIHSSSLVSPIKFMIWASCQVLASILLLLEVEDS